MNRECILARPPERETSKERHIKYEEINGDHVYIIDALVWDKDQKSTKEGQFGLLASDLKKYGARGQSTAIAQFYTLVGEGLILSKHIFEGLERELYCDGSSDADEEKLIYTRKPARDCIWIRGAAGKTHKVDAPPGHCFMVIVSPNTNHKGNYPSVDGWIERWSWVEEDAALADAPIEWVDRFKRRLWSET